MITFTIEKPKEVAFDIPNIDLGADAYNRGYEAGEKDGYLNGYEIGAKEGAEVGYAKGAAEGYEKGHAAGVTDGVEQGKQDMLYTITENGTDFSNLFRSRKITAAPILDTSKGVNFAYMFYDSLTETMPAYDTRNGEIFANMFAYNNQIKVADVEVTEKAKDCSFMFQLSTKLEMVTKPINLSNAQANVQYMFHYSSALKEVRFVPNTIKTSMGFAQSGSLSGDSVQSIIDGLSDLTGVTAQTITFNAAVGKKLTDAQKATITAKNWTLVY